MREYPSLHNGSKLTNSKRGKFWAVHTGGEGVVEWRTGAGGAREKIREARERKIREIRERGEHMKREVGV